jgi:hypothetical protein
MIELAVESERMFRVDVPPVLARVDIEFGDVSSQEFRPTGHLEDPVWKLLDLHLAGGLHHPVRAQARPVGARVARLGRSNLQSSHALKPRPSRAIRIRGLAPMVTGRLA